MDRKVLMRCLTWIMLMVIIGHFFISLTLLYDTYTEGLTSEEMLEHHMYFGILINTTISLNYLIYFFNNQEYRTAFKEQLRILFCRPSVKQSRVSILRDDKQPSRAGSVGDSQQIFISNATN
jgi:Na+/H+-dicarboxylate symporter